MGTRSRSAVAVAGVLAGLVSACGPEQGSSAERETASPVRYVALGDSYTAAPGTGEPVGAPLGCQRSNNNYPRLVAARLDAEEFTDTSCGGATTTHLTEPQPTGEGTNPPQLDAVTQETTLVTLGIGGNDVGLVALASRCARESDDGTPCGREPARGGTDVLTGRIGRAAEQVGEAIEAIRAKAPKAKVVLVGYPTILPDDTSRCASLPYDAADIDYLRTALDRLNDVLRAQARTHDAEFANTRQATEGHGVCAPAGARWIETFDSRTGAAPLHPTARGQQAMAESVLTMLGHR